MADSPRPDFAFGVRIDDLPEGHMLVGRVGEEDAMLVRLQNQCYAIGGLCSHYHGELSKGLIVDDTVRCPLHHACFSLRTGAALAAPALDPVACWRVEQVGGQVFVREKRTPAKGGVIAPTSNQPESVVIVGGGAAALSAALTLRNEGYDRDITLISSDDTAPYDRPNLSKDYLAGTAQEEWLPLRAPEFYADNHLKLTLNTSVQALDIRRKRVYLESGELPFGALLLATGSQAAHVDIAGTTADKPLYLRSLADCRALLKRIEGARRVIILGTGFIGLEAAASLRSRGVEVDIVGFEKIPMERALGPELGALIHQLHVSHGVNFHLGTSIAGVADRTYRLTDGTEVQADVLIAGVGARPRIELAERAGLTLNRGVMVDEYLQTSAPGVFAAGDIARYPAHFSGELIRVEHWVHAERQGQAAARNILGYHQPFSSVPFFWTQQYDLTINYTGHAEKWDRTQIEGDLSKRDGLIRYLRDGRMLAAASVSRDLDNLKADRALELSSAR
jgi:NADPH-dependent 2,4-dienoyl-CoA reductase/sulfur reductase-like enzyme/nitrite reductase/ring-hydroxylating ferredoxin subunit